MKYVLEACVDSVESALAAWRGGAKRIELCSDLVIGGTTPSTAMFQSIKEKTDLEIRVLLRPRFGDFCYSKYEMDILRREVEIFRALGADGVVTGVLKPDGTLNVDEMRILIDKAGDMDVALHRAFDVSANPFQTMEEAVGLGMKTILTSGQRNSAWEGRELLAQLVEKSRDRIEILAAGGIHAEVIRKLVPVTGVSAFHMSGKTVKDSRMSFRREGVNMGLPGLGEFEIWETSREFIETAVKVLKEM